MGVRSGHRPFCPCIHACSCWFPRSQPGDPTLPLSRPAYPRESTARGPAQARDGPADQLQRPMAGAIARPSEAVSCASSIATPGPALARGDPRILRAVACAAITLLFMIRLIPAASSAGRYRAWGWRGGDAQNQGHTSGQVDAGRVIGRGRWYDRSNGACRRPRGKEGQGGTGAQAPFREGRRRQPSAKRASSQSLRHVGTEAFSVGRSQPRRSSATSTAA